MITVNLKWVWFSVFGLDGALSKVDVINSDFMVFFKSKGLIPLFFQFFLAKFIVPLDECYMVIGLHFD